VSFVFFVLFKDYYFFVLGYYGYVKNGIFVLVGVFIIWFPFFVGRKGPSFYAIFVKLKTHISFSVYLLGSCQYFLCLLFGKGVSVGGSSDLLLKLLFL
jgi:hypothetical protein